MPEANTTLVLTPGKAGDVSVTLPGVHVIQGNTEIPIATVKSGDTMPITLKLDTISGSIGPSFNWVVLLALVVPLILTSILGGFVVGGLIKNMGKTMDKLAQLLSESSPPKMSFSRVQALIFTYVIGFGCMLIIARTGQFPTAIPQDLAILAGGSLATFVVSKAIQTQSNTNNPPAPLQPPVAPQI